MSAEAIAEDSPGLWRASPAPDRADDCPLPASGRIRSLVRSVAAIIGAVLALGIPAVVVAALHAKASLELEFEAKLVASRVEMLRQLEGAGWPLRLGDVLCPRSGRGGQRGHPATQSRVGRRHCRPCPPFP